MCCSLVYKYRGYFGPAFPPTLFRSLVSVYSSSSALFFSALFLCLFLCPVSLFCPVSLSCTTVRSPREMDLLSRVTNIQASKDEAIRDILALPKDTLTGIRICLFEECKANGLAHPNDVLVKRRGSAIHPVSKVLGEDMLSLATCLLNRNTVPRVLIKNGKRGSAILESWRNSDKCKVEVEDSRAAAASFTQSFTFEPAPVITSNIIDQPDITSGDDQHPDYPLPNPLPNPDTFASNLIARDLNSLRTDVTTLQSQVGFLERSSDLGIIKNELSQMKSMIAELWRISSFPNTTLYYRDLNCPHSNCIGRSCYRRRHPNYPNLNVFTFPQGCSLELQRTEQCSSLYRDTG